ncbi:Fe-S cluster assembly protein SufB, partial [Candidatus Woesearchaeota archaeon]|nr:Fe-S cluster assembly protein SufB [Candidatus Woesearchaeota archaeon]
YVFKSGKGLSKSIVEEISGMKKEPEWMLKLRLKSLEEFNKKPMPQWGENLNTIDFDNIHYYVKPSNQSESNWDDVPAYIKDTFNKLGIPEAEQKFLGGVGAQYESEVVYHKIRKDLEEKGVVFLDMDGGLREYPEIVKKYFTTVIPYNDNKFAALNTAVWSGGSFVYVPKGVKVDLPLQAYFRINAKNMGQFERTLIIAEPGSSVHYIEGCFEKGAPIKTIDGIKKIEDVKEDDVVLTHTNSYKRVYKLQRRKHTGLMCNINYLGYSGQDIKITGGHPVLAVKKSNDNNRTPEWIEAGKLEKGDYVVNLIENLPNSNKQDIVNYENDSPTNVQQLVLLSQSTENYRFAPITRIEKKFVNNVDVYNFSVEENESYIAHGIVVHNCTAPIYSSDSLHSAVVELIALKGSRIQYTTIQNWSNNVYNLVTKRAFAYEDATVFWVDGNLGSKITMKYPSIYLLGERARAEILSVAFAGKGQHQDAGGKILHFAPNTSSRITSKSVSKDGGRTTYRGLLKVAEGCKNVKSSVTCDALILDDKSASDTVPYMEINEKDVNIEHEATVGKIGEEQLFYLMSRGLSEDQAKTMIVSGFMEPFTKELPLEYAIELNRLIAMNMEGSVG